MFNETARVRAYTGLGTERHFECCERADDAGPRFDDHHRNGSEMRHAKGEAARQPPMREAADNDEDQAPNNECGNEYVHKKHGVGQKRSCFGTHDQSCLTFDMSGGPKGAKRPLERPLDGGVRLPRTADGKRTAMRDRA